MDARLPALGRGPSAEGVAVAGRDVVADLDRLHSRRVGGGCLGFRRGLRRGVRSAVGVVGYGGAVDVLQGPGGLDLDVDRARPADLVLPLPVGAYAVVHGDVSVGFQRIGASEGLACRGGEVRQGHASGTAGPGRLVVAVVPGAGHEVVSRVCRVGIGELHVELHRGAIDTHGLEVDDVRPGAVRDVGGFRAGEGVGDVDLLLHAPLRIR